MIALLRVAALVVVLAVVAVVTGFWVEQMAPHSRIGRAIDTLFQPMQTATAPGEEELPSIAIGGPFDLIDQNGQHVTQDSYAGKYLLVYFGYTTCPDVCPTTLQAIAGALDKLGPQASQIAPLFITVDPSRDTPAVLSRYTALFDRRIIGLTGSQKHIDAVENAYRVYAERVPQPGSDSYLMDHTSFVFLMSPKGDLLAMFNRDVSAATLSVAIAKYLK